MSVRDPAPETGAKPAGAAPRTKRPSEIAERVKHLIVEHDLKPGDRLPAEREMMALFQASKNTVREALGTLQGQGLVRTRTGPGGGVFIAEINGGRAMELLSNYFFFRQPTIGQIYDLRKVLEPEMAASVVGHMVDADFKRLNDTIRLYQHPPKTMGEEYRQRLAELDFHAVLAELCPNPVLGFICAFLQNQLRELSVCRRIYDKPNPELRETGLSYQIPLLSALHNNDAAEARRIMYEHMCAAQAYMVACDAEITQDFMRLGAETPDR